MPNDECDWTNIVKQHDIKPGDLIHVKWEGTVEHEDGLIIWIALKRGLAIVLEYDCGWGLRIGPLSICVFQKIVSRFGECK